MARPEFVPVFEEEESVIMGRMVGRISDEWRKEPGDYIYDAVAPSPLEVKQLQINQDTILKQSSAMYAEGEYMDRKLAGVGLTRIQATYNERAIDVTADAGVMIPKDHVLSVVILDDNGNPLNFSFDDALTFAVTGTQTATVTCKTAGAIGNVVTGSEFILSPVIPGVRVITDNGTTTLARDKETDEEAYVRYLDKINNPDTGGNRNDYVRWTLQQFEGLVGDAKCIPRWGGNGTVKVLIVDASMLPAAAGLVADVQTYLDPGSTGLGDGKAPCGAVVTVAAATSIPINVATATITWDPEANISESTAAFTASVQAYLASLVFIGSPVIYNKILGLLIGTSGVTNFTGLTINAGTTDVVIGAEDVATLGTVTL
ncbi:MAG: baseplate J/gp47 family protein [Desulfosporosinus sp.]|nr:baseplate J/gp47 family protein [Desulfosporosinus sp.]